jgi:uncharacterized phiE125 gp8 family phage protein
MEPVTLEEAKSWLRLSGTTDSDERVADLITGARLAVEQWTGLALITQTVKIYPPCFDATLLLPVAPVASITHVKYYDRNDVQQTYSSDNYELDAKAAPARLRAKWNQTWPSIYDRYNPIEIQAVVGYGGRENVPEPLKMAIKALVSLWHDNDTTFLSRSTMQNSEMPYGVRAMLGTWRVAHYD